MDALVFGRHPTCDIVVNDEYASPKHCRITKREGRYWVEDLGSTNGTWITGGLATFRIGGPTMLQPGEQIRIGRTTLPWTVPNG